MTQIADYSGGGLARQVELDLRVDIHAEASRVACPTLVVGCTHDQIVTRTRDLRDRIPDATCSEIDAGHQAYFEASEEFGAKFLAFANGLHPSGSSVS